MTAWWKCCIPVSAWFCVHCSNCFRNLFFQCWKSKTCPGKTFLNLNFPFRDPCNLSVPRPMGAPATCNISSLQTLSDFSEGLCHMTTGVWEQRAIWPIRRGGDSVGQIGRFTIGCRPGPCGCHPWTSKMSVPPGIKRQNTNDGTFEARRAPMSTKHHLIDCIRL